MATWGELREELVMEFPGIDLSLLANWLTRGYEEILDSLQWVLLEGDSILQTTAPYTTGTVALTLGSNAVTGTGTTFTSGMTGRRFWAGGEAVYTFTQTSATGGTLDRPWEGATNATAGYSIFQARYQLGLAVKNLSAVQNPQLGADLKRLTSGEMARMQLAYQTGQPMYWAPAADTDETTPPVYHQIDLYPVPNSSVGLPFQYVLSPYGFDGSNTSSSPLPWVSTNAIVAHARARCLRSLGKFAEAQAELMSYRAGLQQMILMETQRRPPDRIQMASRFTRHRQDRSTR